MSGGGVAQIRSCASSKMHTARKKKKREGQSHFCKDTCNLVQIKRSLSTEEDVQRAEIIHALKCI